MYSNKFKVLDYLIYLHDNAFDVISSYIQNDMSKPESGGILMGQLKDKTIYIQKVSIPNKFDRSSRYEFIRDKHIAQIILDYEVSNSRNTVTYLGEWHTHPENVPIPSPQDKRMIKEQFDLGRLNVPFVLLLIRGIQTIGLFYLNNKKLYRAIELDNQSDI